MSRFYSSARGKLIANDSGQAMVEFAGLVTLLLILVSASIDFGRALNDVQVMADLTRQGSNLASRGDTLTESVSGVVAGQSGLDLTDYGEVIITSVTNENNVYTITGQASQVGTKMTPVPSSKIGTGVGTNVTSTLPASAESTIQNGQTIFVTEIFYAFTPITPIGKLTQSWPANGTAISLPPVLYDSAYF